MTPGVYDMPLDEYHRDPAPAPSLSSTLVRKLLSQTPRHAWTASPRLNPDWQPDEKTAFDIGRVAHELILGKGAGFAIIDADGYQTMAAREERDAARDAGLAPILRAQYAASQRMAYEVDRALTDMRIDLGDMRREAAMFVDIDGVWCRAMLDAWDEQGGVIYDLKTCEDANFGAAARSVYGYGYDVQNQHYRDVFKALHGQDPGFVFVFVEKKPPHEVGVYRLLDDMSHDLDWMGRAREKCAFARRRWRECLDRDHWPGYPRRIGTLPAPKRAALDWENAKAAMTSQETLQRATDWQAPDEGSTE